jgi:hypothetical protein
MIHTSSKRRNKGTNMANSRNGNSNSAGDLADTTLHLSPKARRRGQKAGVLAAGQYIRHRKFRR